MYTKQASRLRFKFMRDQLSDTQYHQLNASLLRNFQSLPMDGIAYLHTFLPILEKREPNTFLLIDYIKVNYPNTKIVVPKSDLQKNIMTHYVLGEQALMKNKWGIVEPGGSTNQVAVGLIDAVLLPLLSFDMEGNRVGYGKGYYDRFLSECRPDIRKIGLSLFDPVDKIIDCEAHDIPLDSCVTPEKIWVFSK
ncbi:5-formyltetrahydrofolate cyclo-ligase [Olivibacter sp. SA151]|uniref:5-formyltetrahydrofolate cyclo-ligase n=1 Tax=Olivibacter jilunii TaxID=985016 RepID=UPI003F16E6DE